MDDGHEETERETVVVGLTSEFLVLNGTSRDVPTLPAPCCVRNKGQCGIDKGDNDLGL